MKWNGGKGIEMGDKEIGERDKKGKEENKEKEKMGEWRRWWWK